MAGDVGAAMESLLRALRAERRGLGGGAAAAAALVLAAELVRTSARLSADEWEEAGTTAAQAGALSARATTLAERNARAFAAAHALLRPAAGAEGEPGRLGAALIDAAEVLAEIAGAAADVAQLARLAMTHVHADSRPDAAVAVELASATARAARLLIAVNLAVPEDDPRLARAERAVVAAVADANGPPRP